MRYLVKATENFRNVFDIERQLFPEVGEEWEVDEQRMEVLIGNNNHNKKYVDIIKELKEKPTRRKTKKVEE